MRDDRERLLDILEAITRIDKYSAQGRAAFDREDLLQVWIVHYLQIIGEAARSLSPGLKAQHPEIPWAQIVAMRNILVHNYFAADLEEVWSAVEHDLPDLKTKIQAMLSEGKGSG
ncbi:MAG: nucleotidyltransferase [Deltaproteobacteria bacterium RBG_13_61_14]|nr:MAG: nucleotidyltransferase [Deltaproteobacteria bacterium RBG_13_61_14]